MCILALFLVLVVQPMWERICGNSVIDFYGQVVSEDGTGVEGVQVTFKILYSNSPAIPLPLGRAESFRLQTVATDSKGNFRLPGVYGYSVHLDSAMAGRRAMDLMGINLKAQDDPGFGVNMDNRTSRRKLPDSPDKRVVYKLVEHSP